MVSTNKIKRVFYKILPFFTVCVVANLLIKLAESNKKSEPTSNRIKARIFYSGGDDGSRTRVRKEVHASISGCSLSTTFPLHQADKHAGALVASFSHDSLQSLGLFTYSTSMMPWPHTVPEWAGQPPIIRQRQLIYCC